PPSAMPGYEGDYGMMAAGGSRAASGYEMPGGYGASSDYGGMPGGYGEGYSMMGGGPADTNFPKSEAEKIMVRALDFTVEPDTTYRYRVRIVVRNPNYGWEEVSAGVNNKDEELAGPWSEPTSPVTIPADISTYALEMLPDGQMRFRVVKWDPETGLTVYKQFPQKPGDIIGERSGVQIPDETKDKGLKSKTEDFTSRQLIVDARGGDRPLDKIGLTAKLSAPALALIVRPDGTLVLRDQARDADNPEMAEMKDIYDQVIEAHKPESKKSSGSYGEGMPGYGAPGGYGGGRSR
ncbi:MAG: hypothetical protein IRY99_28245, partial [Isosphaeraceae bacterium]|nr:hypothetical protein [Isosphaeraceae bacterium]